MTGGKRADKDTVGREAYRPSEDLLEIVAERIASIGGQDPDFSLVSLDRGRNVVRVHRVGAAGRDWEVAYGRVVLPDIHVEFVDAVLSARQRARLTELVSESRDQLESSGVHLEGWGGDEFGGFVIWHTGPGQVTPDIERRFDLFGIATVRFERGRRAVAV
jgi:hypothetical protein